ncbi:putative methyltransferase, partial [Hamiltosporidium tvaerminnensis]
MNLQQKLQNRIKGAKFRIINEIMTKNKKIKLKNTDIKEYHDGYTQQVNKWTYDPIYDIIEYLKQYSNLTIADVGCGQAKISKYFQCNTKKENFSEVNTSEDSNSKDDEDISNEYNNKYNKKDNINNKDKNSINKHNKRDNMRKYNHKILSFDLYPTSKEVIKCDMEDLKLKDKTTDIIIFCLSLMKINIYKTIKESNRVLKNNGKLIITEVLSRIISVKEFICQVENMGFKILKVRNKNKYFINFIFIKIKDILKENVMEEGVSDSDMLEGVSDSDMLEGV